MSPELNRPLPASGMVVAIFVPERDFEIIAVHIQGRSPATPFCLCQQEAVFRNLGGLIQKFPPIGQQQLGILPVAA